MKDMTQEQLLARIALVKRLEDWAKTVASRDALIREAHEAGVSKAEIARRMDISRTTVVMVVGGDDESGE